MSRQKELVKNTAILTFGKICTQCVSFFLLPLYTAILDTADYGTFDLMITCGALMLPMVGCQLDQGIFRFLIEFRNDEGKQIELFSSSLVVEILLSIIYISILRLFSSIGILQYESFLVWYVILQVFLSLLMQFERGLGNNKTYAIASFISASVTVIFNIFCLVILRLGLEGLFLATILGQMFTIIYLCVVVKPRKYIKVSCINIKILKMLLKYSVPLIPNELSWWVVNVSDRIIVAYFLGVSVNGIYTVANKFSNMFISFYNIFNLSWTETVSLHFSDSDGDEFLSKTMSIMFKMFSCACFVSVAAMPFIFPIMVDEQYGAAYNQIIILLYAMLFRVIVGLYSAVYIATKETKKIAYTSAIAAVINILVNLILINRIGLYAASLSSAVAFGLMSIVRVIDISKRTNIIIDKKVWNITLSIAIILAITYYMNLVILNIVILTLVCIYTIVVNLQTLISILRIVKKSILDFL